jgi:two-component system chemotaxis sensor kinase CheA
MNDDVGRYLFYEGTLSEPKRHSLRAKLITLVVTSLVLVGALTVLTVSVMQYRHAETELALDEIAIRSVLTSKGRMMSHNHALALKSLVADNALNDVRKLVMNAVTQDADVKYGLFLSAERVPWVYVSPSHSDPNATPRDAWRELQISDDEIDAKRDTQRELRLFGGEILEFAAPVFVDDEYLGAIRYGISTASMVAELGEAHKRSNAALTSMLEVLFVVVLVSTGIGLTLSTRRATAIVKPVMDLTAAARAFAAGDRSATVSGIVCGDEVEELAHAFNGMVVDLNKSYASLENLNRTLEHKVQERTAALDRRNRDMALVLDNVNQGLITIALDGVMANERSRVVTTWFGDYEAATRFVDYVAKSDPTFALRFDMNWEALISDTLPIELCLDQMPARLKSNGRQYNVSYTPIQHEDGQLNGVLVNIADVTEALARELEETEQRELLAVFTRVSRDRGGYLAFHREASRTVGDLCSGHLQHDLVLLKRSLHTLKGNAGSLGLSRLASLCHQIEDEMAETNAAPTGELVALLEKRWTRIDKTVSELTGEDDARSLMIRDDDYQRLLARLNQLPAARDLVRDIIAWQHEPIERPLRRLGERAVELARRLGKGELEIELATDNLRVDPKRWDPLWTALLHVVRNAVDHGLQASSATVLTEAPKLSLSAHVVNTQLVIEIADNGVGIQWERVRAKAREVNLPSETRDDLVRALLTDNFTTATRLTEVSGRGVGMAAVCAAVTSLEGQIGVESEPGNGTKWSFSFAESLLSRDFESLRTSMLPGAPPERTSRPPERRASA